MIELAVVLTISAILIIGAVVMMGSMQERERLKGASRTLRADLEYARSVAMSGQVSSTTVTPFNWSSGGTGADANTLAGTTQGGTYRIVRLNSANTEVKVYKTGALPGLDVRFGTAFNENRTPDAGTEGVVFVAVLGGVTYRMFFNQDGTLYRGGKIGFFLKGQGKEQLRIDRGAGTIKLENYGTPP